MPPGAPLSPLRVMVVGDDPLARAGLSSLLAGETGLQVVAQARTDDDLLALAVAERVEGVCWDAGAGSGPPFDGLPELAAGGVPVLALLAHEDEAAAALAAGARGVLPRDAEPARVAAALAALAHGLLALDPALGEGLGLRRGAAATLVEPLTPRENEVLQLLAQGLANKEIARRLRITESTAKFHVTAILGKLGVESRTEALVAAARLGLVIL